MSRKYSPNHPAVMSAHARPAQDLNSPYWLPVVLFGFCIVGGVVSISYLPPLAIFGFPFGFLWAAPFIAGALACWSRCLSLLEQEKKRG